LQTLLQRLCQVLPPPRKDLSSHPFPLSPTKEKTMKSFPSLVSTGVALLMACTHANAQTVYRCGDSYSQTSCAGAISVPVDDARTEAQRAASLQGAASDKALAKEMETSRHHQEATALAALQAEQALQARRAAIDKHPDANKTPRVRVVKKSAVLRTVRVAVPGVFTALAAPATKKKKKKNEPPLKSSAP